MPTSSTARLLAAQQAKKLALGNENNADQFGAKERGGHLYRRFQRPRSSKYDTYRLRARTSVVEENLFGEPLKNKLMSRSRSMEVIGEGYPNDPIQQRMGNPEPTSKYRRLERPRTALANMRPSYGSGKLQDPEFERKSPDLGSFEQKDNKPLLLSRQIFEKIMMAAKVESPEERAKRREEEDEALRAELEACNRRKLELQAVAEFNLTPEITEMEKENNLRNHHIIDRAQELKDEQLPEVKKLNELINRAKCHAILDAQIEEKVKRQNEIVLSQKMLEEQVEVERKQAEEMALARQERIKQFNKDYRQGLLLQRAEQEAQKLLALERKEIEMELRRKQEEADRLKEEKEAANKREKMILMKQQTALEIEEAKQRKAAEAEQRRIDEQQIEALQTVRRNAEIAKDQEDKRMKKEKEREMARMKERIEQEHDLTLKREQLRLLRQQEAEDRKIRKQELEAAQAKVQQDEEIKMVLLEQIRQRQENAAQSVELDRKYWEGVQKSWHETTEAEKIQNEEKARRKQDYLKDLKSQIAVRENIQNEEKLLERQDKCGQDTDRKSYQDRLCAIREKKLKELRAYNVPEKYLQEIEKKCQQVARAKLTKGFFGMK